MTFRFIRRKLVISIGSCIVIVLMVTWASITDNIDYQLSCHVMDQLSNSVNTDIRPIFFTETSGRSSLSYRAACSIESAAQHHPRWPIVLYNTSSINNDNLLQTLQQLPNFQLRDLNLETLFDGTPLSHWYHTGAYRQGPYWVEKLSDAIRLVLLWTSGGIYLDTDVIVLRSMATLTNCIGLENLHKVNGAVLVFDRNSPFLRHCMEEFERHYSPLVWGAEGPTLLTKVVRSVCRLDDDLYAGVVSKAQCGRLTVLPWHSFYPLPWPMWPKLFSVVADHRRLNACSYTLHMWNSMSKQRHAILGSKQMLDLLAQNNCPNVYQFIKSNHRLPAL